jgi:NADH:ubiquinone oxidoreductase subunit 3 (subunit A)
LYPQFNDPQYAGWAQGLTAQGYSPAFFFATAMIFFAILAVGFVYEWRKGIFKWD